MKITQYYYFHIIDINYNVYQTIFIFLIIRYKYNPSNRERASHFKDVNKKKLCHLLRSWCEVCKAICLVKNYSLKG